MTQTISISKSEFEKLVKRIEMLEKKFARFMRPEPSYGSPQWWEKEEREADEDIKAGRVYGPFKNASDLVKSLHKESAKFDQ